MEAALPEALPDAESLAGSAQGLRSRASTAGELSQNSGPRTKSTITTINRISPMLPEGP